MIIILITIIIIIIPIPTPTVCLYHRISVLVQRFNAVYTIRQFAGLRQNNTKAFVVLSSWYSHRKSSPSSNMMNVGRPSGRRLSDQDNWLGLCVCLCVRLCGSVSVRRLLLSTSTTSLIFIAQLEIYAHFTVPRKPENRERRCGYDVHSGAGNW